MKNKKIFLLSLILLAILLIGAVSASEDVASEDTSISVSDDVISEDTVAVSDEGAPVVDLDSANDEDDSSQSVDDEIILGEGDDEDENNPYYTFVNDERIITDTDDDDYDDEAIVAGIILPPDTEDGHLDIFTDDDVEIARLDVEAAGEGPWHIDENGNLKAHVYLRDLDLTDVNDGDNVNFLFFGADGRKVDEYSTSRTIEITDSYIRFIDENSDDEEDECPFHPNVRPITIDPEKEGYEPNIFFMGMELAEPVAGRLVMDGDGGLLFDVHISLDDWIQIDDGIYRYEVLIKDVNFENVQDGDHFYLEFFMDEDSESTYSGEFKINVYDDYILLDFVEDDEGPEENPFYFNEDPIITDSASEEYDEDALFVGIALDFPYDNGRFTIFNDDLTLVDKSVSAADWGEDEEERSIYEIVLKDVNLDGVHTGDRFTVEYFSETDEDIYFSTEIKIEVGEGEVILHPGDEIDPDDAKAYITKEVKYRNNIPFLIELLFGENLWDPNTHRTYNNVIVYINDILAFNSTVYIWEDGNAHIQVDGDEGEEIHKGLDSIVLNEYHFLDEGEYSIVVYLLDDEEDLREIGRNDFTVLKQKGDMDFDIDLFAEEEEHTFLHVNIPDGNWDEYYMIVNINYSEIVDVDDEDYDEGRWLGQCLVLKDDEIFLVKPLDEIIGQGQVDIDLGVLDEDTHVWVEFNHADFLNRKYDFYQNEFTINRHRIGPELTIAVDDISYGNDANIVIGTNSTFSGPVTVQIDGSNYTVDVNNGEGQLTVSGLDAGNYTAKAIFAATDVFNEAEATFSFVVNKADSSVSCDPITFDYGNSGTVTATVDGATGVTAVIEGYADAVIAIDGLSITVSNLNAGNYDLSVTTIPDINHIAKTISVPVTVNRINPNFVIAPIGSVEEGDPITISISADTGFVGDVTVSVGDNSATIHIAEGVGTCTLSTEGLAPGVYTVDLISEEAENYNASGASATFTITEKVVPKVGPALTITAEDIVFGEDETIVIGTNNTFSGLVTVQIDGNTYDVNVNNGIGSLSVSSLNAGTYTAKAIFAATDVFNEAEATVSFVVNKADSSVSCNPISFDYGSSGSGTLTVEGATVSADNIAVVDHAEAVIIFENNVVTVSNLGAGSYALTITTSPNDNHNAVIIIVPVTVNRVDATVEVTDVTFDYGDSGVVTTVVDGGVGIEAAIDGSTDHVTVDGYKVTVSGLDVGTYTLSVTAVPDANHNAVSATATVTVNKVDCEVTVGPISFDYGGTGTATASVVGATGITAAIDGHEGVVEVDGLSITVSGLDAGDYTLTVTAVPDANHNAKIITVPVTVNKINPNFVIAPIESVDEGDPITISISEDTGFVGDVTVSVSENTATISIAKGVGTGSLSTEGLVPGEYTVDLVSEETDNYNAGGASATFTINEKVVPKVDPSLTITVEDIDFGSDAIVVINTNETFSGTVKVQVVGNYTVEVINGEGQVLVSGLEAGTYTVKVIFEATDAFNEDEKNVDFIVNKVDSTVSCGAIAFEYGSSGTVTAVVEGATGITASIAGFANAAKVDGNKITVSGLDPGNYSLIVTTVPDANHNANTITVPVTVNGVKKRIATKIIYSDMNTAPVNINTDGRIGNYFVVKLVDANGKILPGLPIKIGFNGNIYERNITSNGAASLQINLKKEDVYTFAIYFSGDKDYLGSFAVAKITVSKSYPKPNKANQNAIGNPVSVSKTSTKISTVIKYSDMVTTTVHNVDGRIGKYFNIKLVDKSGKALAGKSIKIGFNGNIYSRTTDANGAASLQINLKKATVYTFAISFLEDDKYQGSFAVAKITVNPQTPKLTASSKTFKASTKTKKISATFKTAHGNPVKGIKITFTVKGKTYSATTNAKGVATVSISLTKKGTYTAVAKFAANTCFKATSRKFTVKIT